MIGRDILLTGKEMFSKAFGGIATSINKAFGTQINKFIAPLRFLAGGLFKAAKHVTGGLISAPIKMLEMLGNRSQARNIARGDIWSAEQSIKFSDRKEQYVAEYEQDKLNAKVKINEIKKHRGEVFEDVKYDRETNKKIKEINKAFKKAEKGKLTKSQQAELDAINGKYADSIKGEDGILYEAQRNKEYREKLDQFKASRLQEVVKQYGLDDKNSELGSLRKSNTDIGRYIRKALGLPEEVSEDIKNSELAGIEEEAKRQEDIIETSREQVNLLQEKIKQDEEQINTINEQIKIEQQTIETMKSLKATLESLAGKDGKLTDEEEKLYNETESKLSELGDIVDHKNIIDSLKNEKKEIKKSKKETEKESKEVQKVLNKAKKEKDKLIGQKKALNGNGRGNVLSKFKPSNFFKVSRTGRGDEEVPQASVSKATPVSDPRNVGEGGFEEGSTAEYNYKKEKEEERLHDNAMFSSVTDIGKTVKDQFKWMQDKEQKQSMWKMVKFIGGAVGKIVGFLGGKLLDLLSKIPVIGTAIDAVRNFFTGGSLMRQITGLFGKNKSAVMNVKAGIVNVNGGSSDDRDFDMDWDNDNDNKKNKKNNKNGKTKKKSIFKKATDKFKNSKFGKSKVGRTITKAGSVIKNTKVGDVVGKAATAMKATKAGGTISKAAKAVKGTKTLAKLANFGSKAVKLVPLIGTAGAAIASAPAWAVAAGTAALGATAYGGYKLYKNHKEKKEAEQQATGNGIRRNNFLNFNGSGSKSIASSALSTIGPNFASKMENLKESRQQKVNFIKSIFEIGVNIAEIKDVVKDIADLSGASIQISSQQTVPVSSPSGDTSTTTSSPVTGSTPKFRLFKPSTWKYLGRGDGFAYNNGRGEANGYTYYNQNDSRWSNYSMDTGEGDTLGSAGCGPTTMAMAINSMGGKVSPIDAARYAVEGGYKVPNEGVDASFISDYARANGLGYQARYVDNYAQNDIDISLASGQPVIALGSTGRGKRNGRGTPYTDSGHYVMITGKDANGNYMVNDPLNSRNNNRSFSPNELLGHTNSYWVDGNIDGSQMDVSGMYGRGGEKVRMFEKVVQYARSFLGKLTYSQQKREAINNNGSTSDCSSFARHVMRTVAGIDPGGYTGEQISYGTNVGFNNAQPGDLVFFKSTGHTGGHGSTRVSHVGIVSDRNGNMIDIGSTPGAKERSYNSNYWKPKQLQVRRVLKDPNELVDPTIPNANEITGFIKATKSGQPDVSGGGAMVSTDGTSTDTSMGSSSSSSGNLLSDILGEVSSMFTATLSGKEYVPGGSSTSTDSSTSSTGGDTSYVNNGGTNGVYDGNEAFAKLDKMNTDKKINFVKKVQDGALDGYSRYGLLPSITIAQGIEESGWGTSAKAVNHNNLFGIKGKYNGQSDGNGFRKYPSWNHSVLDHNRLLGENSRYKKVIDAKNYSDACTALNNSGYCEGNVYGGKIKSHIEAYKLYEYDKLKPKNTTSSSSTNKNTTIDPSLITGAGRRKNTVKYTSSNGRGSSEVSLKPTMRNASKKTMTHMSNVKAMSQSTSLEFSTIITLLTEIRDSNRDIASSNREIAQKDFNIELTKSDTVNYTESNGDVKVNTDIKADTNPFLAMGGTRSQNFSSYDSMRDSINRIATGL